ncbi:hypothetical protein CMI47_02755 [Candidatus Pacearchaeota archaeon]|nr:hypothetical protein [Candidatus Pacearchaeota archaeon]|tara:strand:+ start:3121 stop:4155 length:1035 start_codon:yes stop_codon:yes gene_type:complete
MNDQWGFGAWEGYDEFLGDEFLGDDQYGVTGGLIGDIASGAMAVGGLIDLGFKAEYHPRRRMKLAADIVPSYYEGIKRQVKARGKANQNYKKVHKKWSKKNKRRFKRGPLKGKVKDPLGRAHWKARKKYWTKRQKRINKGRPMLWPMPNPLFFGLPVPVPVRPALDDHKDIKIYKDCLIGGGPCGLKRGKAHYVRGNDGGSIAQTREILRGLFIESLMFSLMPEVVAFSDPEARAARETAITTREAIFTKPDGMAMVFGPDEDTLAKRLPRGLREEIIGRYLQWHHQGMIGDNQPLPPWLFGFRVDRKGKQPMMPPTVGSFLALRQAAGEGRLTPDVIKNLKAV